MENPKQFKQLWTPKRLRRMKMEVSAWEKQQADAFPHQPKILDESHLQFI